MSLEEIRRKIDIIDKEIVGLLDERGRLAKDAAVFKQEFTLPIHDPARERIVANRLAGLSDGGMPMERLTAIYRVILAETRALQETAPRPCPGQIASAGKVDAVAEVLENIEIARGFYAMTLRACELVGRFNPGQFFQLGIASCGGKVFLRRPFAPSRLLDDGLAFVYSVVGEGTRFMSRLKAGSQLRVLAPLGNTYTLLPAGSSALLIGGGCGGPSLAPLAKRLHGSGVRVTVVLGARTASVVLEHRLFQKVADRVIMATEDGSGGCRGTVIDACRLENLVTTPPDRIYACGPRAMLRATGDLAEELGVPCELSLEERMACGFGACMGCAVGVKDERAADGIAYRRVCHDGPVFDARSLVW